MHCWQLASQPANQLASQPVGWAYCEFEVGTICSHFGVSLLEPPGTYQNLQNLPTRFSAPKAFQRRALYRSELPQVQEAKPGMFWGALGRSELAFSKHCGIVNASFTQNLHVMLCPNCCDAIVGCHGGLLWRRHTCTTRGTSRAPSQANPDNRRDSAAHFPH